jgi:NitT/TauT family transport system substrate-binding protein
MVTITVAMHWVAPTTTWTGFLTAQDKGYYADEGLKIDFKYLNGSTLAVQETGAANTNLGVAAPDSVLAAALQKIPITVVANHLQNDATGLIAKPESGIKTWADLRGRTVSTAQASAEAALFAGTLGKQGLDGSAVKTLYVDPQAKCTVMLSGQSDACTGFSTAQLIQVRQKAPGAVFLPFSTAENPLPGHVIFGNNAWLANNADVVKRFLKATVRGYVAAEKDEASTIALLQRLDKQGDPQVIAQAVPLVHKLMHSERTAEKGFGWMTDRAWQNLYDYLVEGKVLKSGLDLRTVYTNTYLPSNATDWR